MLREHKDRTKQFLYRAKPYAELRKLAKDFPDDAPEILFFKVMNDVPGQPALVIQDKHLKEICDDQVLALCLNDMNQGIVHIAGRYYPDYFFYCISPEVISVNDNIWTDLDAPIPKEEKAELINHILSQGKVDRNNRIPSQRKIAMTKSATNKLTHCIKPYSELLELRERMAYKIISDDLVFFEIMWQPKGKNRDLVYMTREHLSDFSRRKHIELNPKEFKEGKIVIEGQPYPDYFFFVPEPVKRSDDEYWDGLDDALEMPCAPEGNSNVVVLEAPEVIGVVYPVDGSIPKGIAGARVSDRMFSKLEGLGHVSDFCVTEDGDGGIGVAFIPDSSIDLLPSIYNKDGVPVVYPKSERMLFFVGPGDTGRFDDRPDDSVFYQQDEKVYVTDDPGVYKCRDTDSAVKAHFREYRKMRNGNNYRVYPYGTTSWTSGTAQRTQQPKPSSYKYCWKAEDE